MRVIILFLALFVVTQCHTSKDLSTPQNIPALLPGFALIASPNALEKPGRVFAVDKNGVPQYLGSINVTPESGAIQPAEASGKRTSSVSTLFNFLGMDKYSVDANANSNFNKEFDYLISLKECTEETVPLLSVNKDLEQMRDAIRKFSASNNMSNYKYYLVTSAVKAKQVSYQFGKSKIGNIDLKLDIQKIVDANPKVNWDNKKDLKLDVNFLEPLYVYAKYWTLNVQSHITGESTLEIGKEVKDESPVHGKSR